MVSFKALLLGATVSLAFPSSPNTPPAAAAAPALVHRRDSTPSSEGRHGGFYYRFWEDGKANGQVNYRNGPEGSYTVNWTMCSNFFGGKGWDNGDPRRTISYSGSYQPNGNGWVSVYGWTSDPFVEYYVVESFGTLTPGAAISRPKRMHANGSNYTIGVTRRHAWDEPTLVTQVWSIRDRKRVAGTVDMGLHFDAWEKEFNVTFGKHDWQLVAIEGYYSSGNVSITVQPSL
ncbi:putative endo-1,4-beta-xylanase A [Rhypophila decipiens]